MNRNEKLPENYFKYDAWIQEFSALYKLPWKLVKAQVWQESAFDPSAVSPCGAQGLLQLMPETDFMLDGDMTAKTPGETWKTGSGMTAGFSTAFPRSPTRKSASSSCWRAITADVATLIRRLRSLMIANLANKYRLVIRTPGPDGGRPGATLPPISVRPFAGSSRQEDREVP